MKMARWEVVRPLSKVKLIENDASAPSGKREPKNKVAYDTATKDNMVMVAGETTTSKDRARQVVRGYVRKIGLASYADDWSSVGAESDTLLKKDPKSKEAYETATKTIL